jgi:hypothetical protein
MNFVNSVNYCVVAAMKVSSSLCHQQNKKKKRKGMCKLTVRFTLIFILSGMLTACGRAPDSPSVEHSAEDIAAPASLLAPAAGRGNNPDILLIMVDDLNTMIAPMGDPQAITPNISELASRGMLFTNAHSIAPQCNAIRTAALFGLLPSSTGVYNNGQDWRSMELFEDKPSLPRYFKDSGYLSFGAGKIFHAHTFFSWWASRIQ